jgi:hypothetical protein
VRELSAMELLRHGGAADAGVDDDRLGISEWAGRRAPLVEPKAERFRDRSGGSGSVERSPEGRRFVFDGEPCSTDFELPPDSARGACDSSGVVSGPSGGTAHRVPRR